MKRELYIDKGFRNKKIYLAGPLFVKSEILERNEQAKALRKLGFDVYNPLEQNNIVGFDKKELYELDIQAMEEADFAVINLDNLDSGTVAELGWFVGKGKLAYSIWTNWKSTVPGNLFVTGLAMTNENILFNDFDSLLDLLSI